MTNPKKILHIFSTFEVGGAQRRFANYVAKSGADFSHHIYAMDGCYDALQLVDGVSTIEDGQQVVAKGNTIAATLKCRKLLKKHKPDLLVTYNWGAIEWVLANSLLALCPTIHIQDGFASDEQNKELFSRRVMRAFAYRWCTKVVVPSLTLLKQARKGWYLSAQKLAFIPNGIETARFGGAADPDIVQAYDLKGTDIIVGTVAGLRLEKNVGRLIEAFSNIEDSHPECKLVIVGDGIGLAPLQMLADRVCRKGRVIFTRNMKRPEAILPAFDIFALSSDTEQMPLSVLEAMAAGLPVVSTDVGDIAEMVAPENKPFIAGKNAKTLGENLTKIIEDTDLAIQIGAKNKAKAESIYGIERMVETYDSLFQDTIKSP
ncbi:MAG: glycosyltransferase family 4 protein [Kordiimonadaceae bacterium]|nr:glycosyltransferase family 4 protein [Kordiimonadaceae bacterium]